MSIHISFHQHPLLPYIFDGVNSDKICQVCMRPLALSLRKMISTHYYRCIARCDFFLHSDCLDLIKSLIRVGQVLHSLHPQHSLSLEINKNININPKFVCSFCNTSSIESEKPVHFFFRCSVCHFYLHIACSIAFMHSPELLSNKYQIQHFLHHPSNVDHCLSPSFKYSEKDEYCHGCGQQYRGINFIFECITCDNFSMHVHCSRLPKRKNHISHPQHPLTLIVPNYSMAESNDNTLRCHGCRSSNRDKFVFHCAECCFNIDIKCAYLKPNMIPNHHGHPLVHFEKIYLNDVLCSACNTPCKQDSFRCIPCNYNIHPHCIPLPSTVDYYDHIHPLTLTPSFIEDDSGHYFCDICETRRDPNHGVYLCKECPFVAHFQCALPEDNPWMLEASSTGKLGHDSEIKGTKAADNSIAEDTIYRQWREEITKLERVVQGLIDNKKNGIQLTEEKLKELDERHANTECKLKHLKQSFRGTN